MYEKDRHIYLALTILLALRSTISSNPIANISVGLSISTVGSTSSKINNKIRHL